MKKIILPFLLFVGLSVFAQGKFTEGVIVMQQKMTSSNEQINAQLAMMGEMKTTSFIKGNKSRSELSNQMSGDVTTIFDGDKKEMILMMDNPLTGKKYMQKGTEPSKEELEALSVTKTNETKEILGYKCDKYEFTINQNGAEVKGFLFATNQIVTSSQASSQYGDKVKGFPLYTEMDVNQMGMDMKMIMEVTEIKKESVSDDKFDMTVPEGYEKVDNIPGM
jgi:outer membrane lipoprotein-sorting protein